MEYGLDMVKLAYMAGSNGRTMTKTKFFAQMSGHFSYPWCSARVSLARGALLKLSTGTTRWGNAQLSFKHEKKRNYIEEISGN